MDLYDNEKDCGDVSLLFSELNTYFSSKENKSMIRVQELFDILIPYIRDSRKNEYISYGKTLEAIKKFNAPMSSKQWELVVDNASLKELEKRHFKLRRWHALNVPGRGKIISIQLDENNIEGIVKGDTVELYNNGSKEIYEVTGIEGFLNNFGDSGKHVGLLVQQYFEHKIT